MPGCLRGIVGGRHEEALEELRAELAVFRTRGLRALRRDIAGGRVARGRWSGCPLSYRGGRPGGCVLDRRGRAHNPFTQLWDAGWLGDTDVASAVARELSRRSRRLTPAIVGD